jgi:hypothetical protein
VRTRFKYEGDVVVEIIRDGEDVDVVVRPQEATDDTLSTDVQPLQVAEPLQPIVHEEPKQRRGLKAFIRGMWTFLIAVFVEGGSYLVNNLTAINLPPGLGLVAGAGLQGVIYGAKKFVAPDSLI